MILEKQKQAHDLVVKIINSNFYTRIQIKDIIGITMPTLKSRLDSGNWTSKEVDIILSKLT